MRKKLLFALVASVCICGMSYAQEDYSTPNTPWLKDVKISPYLTEPSPTLPMQIFAENGKSVPATLTEDIPILVMAETAIFEPNPPESSKGVILPNSRWEEKPVINWYFVDWETNKNTPAILDSQLAVNQMYIKPKNPTGKGAITCYSSRKMRYDKDDGTTKATYANSSRAADVTVLDITPPLCGFEITTKDGKKGTCWPVENPPDKYPLPKLADVHFTGSLFGVGSNDIVVSGLELGDNMAILKEQAVLSVSRRDILTVKVIGGDNYKLNTEKIRFGICDGPNGSVVGPINEEKIQLSKLRIPERPYLFIEAYDLAGNKQAMFIPMEIRRR